MSQVFSFFLVDYYLGFCPLIQINDREAAPDERCGRRMVRYGGLRRKV